MTLTGKFPVNYCMICGHQTEVAVPEGDDRQRYICRDCGHIHYQNPKLVAGAIAEASGRILLCRRAIEPAHGKWTLPAGFLENGETVAECACRETREEACARLEGLKPYAMVSLPTIDQIYFIFRASLGGSFAAGPESLEVELFEPAEIPWKELAFASIRAVLHCYRNDFRCNSYRFRALDVRL